MKDLIQGLIDTGTLRTPAIIAAFRAIDRANFVRPEHRAEAYVDHPLPIGAGQTISQPTTVAFMLELLSPDPGNRILDVGSGSGWTTALLAHIVGDTGAVFGVERISELVTFGTKNLERYDFKNASIQCAGSALGLPDQAPFDRILVSAAGDTLPQALVDQLAPQGIMVIPIGTSIFRIKKHTDESIEIKEFPGFAFVPLLP